MINFYINKTKDLPRFFYRNFFNYIKKNNISNNDALEIFKKILSDTNKSDYLKFTWHLPRYFSDNLDSELVVQIESLLLKRRSQRPKKIIKHVFPHVSDEFSLSEDFLSMAFDQNNLPLIKKDDAFFSFGSCFARNFTTFLNSKKIKAFNYAQAEDLNSPGSNSTMLEYVNFKNENLLESDLSEQIEIFWKEYSDEIKNKILNAKLQDIYNLKKNIQQSNKIIITLGNTIDFYYNINGQERIAPKFISLTQSENVNEKTIALKRMKNAGAYFRMSKFDEIKNYIIRIYCTLKNIAPAIEIIFTVSPIPVDSIIGIEDKLNMNIVEIDCISKSTIRAALNEALISEELINDKKIFYLPSFEIVRWIAPVVGIPVFGQDDASSRHVSNIILNAVCDFIYNQSQIIKKS